MQICIFYFLTYKYGYFRADPCSSDNQCKNGATCIFRPDLELNHFTCVCTIGFTGKFCEIKISNDTDSNQIGLKEPNVVRDNFEFYNSFHLYVMMLQQIYITVLLYI